MIDITCSALLFDLDGVLIDSTRAVNRVWKQWALEHGLNPHKVIQHAHGRPSIDTVREFLPGVDAERENRKVEAQEIRDVADIVAFEGAQELLGSLPADRWTIATSGTRPLAEARLRAAGLVIPARMITASDITKGKPNPEPYQNAAALLGFNTEDCVVIEDVVAGVRAGKAAGARVIAVRTTASDADLCAAGATWIVDGCKAISVAGKAQNHLLLRLTIDRN